MGLSVSHGAFRAPYQDFHRLRVALWRASGGACVRDPDGGEDPDVWHGPWRWAAERNRALMGIWPDGEPGDPLLVLIHHADNAGVILRRDTRALAARIEGLLVHLDGRGGRFSERQMALRLAAGLRRADREGDDVLFG